MSNLLARKSHTYKCTGTKVLNTKVPKYPKVLGKGKTKGCKCEHCCENCHPPPLKTKGLNGHKVERVRTPKHGQKDKRNTLCQKPNDHTTKEGRDKCERNRGISREFKSCREKSREWAVSGKVDPWAVTLRSSTTDRHDSSINSLTELSFSSPLDESSVSRS